LVPDSFDNTNDFTIGVVEGIGHKCENKCQGLVTGDQK